MKNNSLPRLDTDEGLRQKVLPFCRLKPGETWVDPVQGHKVERSKAGKMVIHLKKIRPISMMSLQMKTKKPPC